MKENCEAVNFSRKETNEFAFTSKRRVFVCFLEEIEDSKKAFRNFWPLETVLIFKKAYSQFYQTWTTTPTYADVFCFFLFLLNSSEWKNQKWSPNSVLIRFGNLKGFVLKSPTPYVTVIDLWLLRLLKDVFRKEDW